MYHYILNLVYMIVTKTQFPELPKSTPVTNNAIQAIRSDQYDDLITLCKQIKRH